MDSQVIFHDCVYILSMELFAERLKELREEKNLTFKELAVQTGLSKSALCFWENGKRTPNAEAIVTLAKFFKVSADYLLGLSD